MKELEDLMAQKNDFDNESQAFLDSLAMTREEIDKFNSMKRTEGWKLLDKKIREELQERIAALVKDDSVVNILLAILTVTAVKKRSKELEETIKSILPE